MPSIEMNETMNFCFVNKYLQFLAGNWNKNKKIKKIILGYHFQQGIVKINEREREKKEGIWQEGNYLV